LRRGFGQAVEKVTKALLLAQGIVAGIEHRFEELFKRVTLVTQPWVVIVRATQTFSGV